MRQIFALAAIFLAVLTVPAAAAPFSNGDFEVGVAPGGSTVLPPGSTDITDWTTIGTQTTYFGTSFSAFQGARSVGVYASDDVGQSGITQTFDVESGKTYRVSFRYSALPGDPSSEIHGITSGIVSGAQTASITIGFPKSLDESTHSAADPLWLPVSYSFIAGDDEAVLTIMGVAGGIFSSASRGIVDSVTVTAVPIPMALPLFLAGLGALGVLRRSRKARTP
jgi:hypothetical protein